jgi:hypothetical protein
MQRCLHSGNQIAVSNQDNYPSNIGPRFCGPFGCAANHWHKGRHHPCLLPTVLRAFACLCETVLSHSLNQEENWQWRVDLDRCVWTSVGRRKTAIHARAKGYKANDIQAMGLARGFQFDIQNMWQEQWQCEQTVVEPIPPSAGGTWSERASPQWPQIHLDKQNSDIHADKDRSCLRHQRMGDVVLKLSPAGGWVIHLRSLSHDLNL